MKRFATALLIGLAAAPAAMAQTAPAPAPAPSPAAAPAAAPAAQGAPAAGATVKDTAGGTVGTIEAVNGDLAVINTGTNKVSYPLASITNAPTGPIIALTKAQLDATVVEQQAKAQADLQAKLVAGTQVFANDGTTAIGTIKAVDPQFVTVTAAKGDVKLPAGGFAAGPNGVVIGLSAADFAKATGGK